MSLFTSQNIQIMRSCVLFQRLAETDLARLAGIAVRKRYAAGEMILRQGVDCPAFGIVVSGQVKVYALGPQGKDHVLHLAGPGRTFGEVAALGRLATPANAVAAAPSQCLMFPTVALHQLLREDHSLCLAMLSGLAIWVRHFVDLLENLILRDAGGRLARYLLDRQAAAPGPIIELPGPKRDIASHLNLTQETLSRLLRRFREAGLIAPLPRRRVQILDRSGLLAIAALMGQSDLR